VSEQVNRKRSQPQEHDFTTFNPLLNRRCWCHLANTLKTFGEQVNCQNLMSGRATQAIPENTIQLAVSQQQLGYLFSLVAIAMLQHPLNHRYFLPSTHEDQYKLRCCGG